MVLQNINLQSLQNVLKKIMGIFPNLKVAFMTLASDIKSLKDDVDAIKATGTSGNIDFTKSDAWIALEARITALEALCGTADELAGVEFN